MKSLADGLPPEIARQIHPDRRKNEAAYSAARDQLLGQYQGQWIGFADGVVVAAGTRPVVVFHAAHQAAEHPYVICVGREEEPYRMRRANFAYDGSYSGEALPAGRPGVEPKAKPRLSDYKPLAILRGFAFGPTPATCRDDSACMNS